MPEPEMLQLQRRFALAHAMCRRYVVQRDIDADARLIWHGLATTIGVFEFASSARELQDVGKCIANGHGPNQRTYSDVRIRRKATTDAYTWPGSNWRPSACEADVIATRPQVRVLLSWLLPTQRLMKLSRICMCAVTPINHRLHTSMHERIVTNKYLQVASLRRIVARQIAMAQKHPRRI